MRLCLFLVDVDKFTKTGSTTEYISSRSFLLVHVVVAFHR